MPIPLIFEEFYDQGLAKGVERGREQAFEQMTVPMLRAKFGTELDPTTERCLAQRLIALAPEEIVVWIEAATTVDDLD